MNAQHSNYRRIVVTDDDPNLLTFVVTTLRDAGHCVFAAYDADVGLRAGHRDYRAGSDDHQHPPGHRVGADTDRQVRQQKPDLPILHVGDPLPNPDGLLSDVPNLQEPFTAEELLAAVRSLLARREARA